jgi:hypothetical protein
MIGLAGLLMFLLSIIEALLALRGAPLDFFASGIFLAGALLSLMPVQRWLERQFGWNMAPQQVLQILLILFLVGGLVMFVTMMQLEPGTQG